MNTNAVPDPALAPDAVPTSLAARTLLVARCGQALAYRVVDGACVTPDEFATLEAQRPRMMAMLAELEQQMNTDPQLIRQQQLDAFERLPRTPSQWQGWAEAVIREMGAALVDEVFNPAANGGFSSALDPLQTFARAVLDLCGAVRGGWVSLDPSVRESMRQRLQIELAGAESPNPAERLIAPVQPADVPKE